MLLKHSATKTHARFDDPNLVSCAGLVEIMRLAERAGLPELIAEHVRPAELSGVHADLKIGCLVAGMVAGADSIDDMNLLRHDAVSDLFAGVRAPSTGNVKPIWTSSGRAPDRGSRTTTRTPSLSSRP